MPLEKLDLKNFQCHRSLSIEFDPLITTLVGKTNSGKSAVLRALRWLVQNVPAGDEFISDGEKYCRTRLIVDGHRVIRRIGDRNEYRLDDKVYKAFGRGVPPSISKLLNLADENFQSQLDAPFWFSLTPGQVAKELNRIVDLSVIDKTLANLAQVSRQATSEVSLTKTRLQEAKQAKEKLAWVPAMDQRLGVLQAKGKTLVAKNDEKTNLLSLIQYFNELELDKQHLSQCLSKGIQLCKKSSSIQQSHKITENLQTHIKKSRELKIKLQSLKKQIVKTKKKLNCFIGRRCPICKSIIKEL